MFKIFRKIRFDLLKENKIICILILILFFIYGCTKSVQIDERKKDIDNFIMHYAESRLLNGVAMIVDGEKIIYQKAYGLEDPEGRKKHRIDGKFQIYSISKQFTSLLIMQLVEEGLIDIYEPITKYLDYYRKDTGDKITIHHLLTHSHGIPIPDWDSIPLETEFVLDKFIKNYLSGDLEFEPGTKFSYSWGHTLAAAIIEKVTGKSFESVLHERILIPLNLNNTGIYKSDENLKKYTGSFNKYREVVSKRLDRHYTQSIGASSLYSTANDLYTWNKALHSNKLLTKSYCEKMYAPHIQVNRKLNYGYGLRTTKMQIDSTEKKLVWHGGGDKNIICQSIDDDLTVILLNNFSTDLSLYSVSEELLKILYNQPYEFVKIHIYEVIRQIIEERGINSAIDHYHYLKSKYLEYYHFSEDELNILGYYFMYYKDYEVAIRIFELNTHEYPNSSNVFDSLGEAYMEDGQIELAIKNYERSLELNPDNKNAVLMLEKLMIK
jgi:CubicO group peptidase (beta-lactamase class C family)